LTPSTWTSDVFGYWLDFDLITKNNILISKLAHKIQTQFHFLSDYSFADTRTKELNYSQ
jgi:hypothetical protein